MIKNLLSAANQVREISSNPVQPQVGLVLGSGLSAIAQHIQDPIVIPYSQIPYFQSTSIQGHPGSLVLGKIDGTEVACLQGRFHYYEGIPMESVTFPVRLLCTLGVRSIILVNAVGAINTRYRPGDTMLIEDHLNLTGTNPLIGPNFDELGPRFPDLSEAYRRDSLKILQSEAETMDFPVHTGVYAGVCGPSYETPAEIRMLRTLGADVVGMSTVSECIAAVHMGVRVAGVCCISNLAAGLSPHPLSHAEVLEAGRCGAEKIGLLLRRAVPKIGRLS